MTLAESSRENPTVPHSWICNGKLLVLEDPKNPNNINLFQVKSPHCLIASYLLFPLFLTVSISFLYYFFPSIRFSLLSLSLSPISSLLSHCLISHLFSLSRCFPSHLLPPLLPLLSLLSVSLLPISFHLSPLSRCLLSHLSPLCVTVSYLYSLNVSYFTSSLSSLTVSSLLPVSQFFPVSSLLSLISYLSISYSFSSLSLSLSRCLLSSLSSRSSRFGKASLCVKNFIYPFAKQATLTRNSAVLYFFGRSNGSGASL